MYGRAPEFNVSMQLSIKLEYSFAIFRYEGKNDYFYIFSFILNNRIRLKLDIVRGMKQGLF